VTGRRLSLVMARAVRQVLAVTWPKPGSVEVTPGAKVENIPVRVAPVGVSAAVEGTPARVRVEMPDQPIKAKPVKRALPKPAG
jgi:hypothetical protein